MPDLPSEFDDYLKPTAFIDSDDPAVIAYAEQLIGEATDDVEKARRLFYGVRDDIRYAPYGIEYSRSALTASATLARGEAFCVPKAVLLAAVARAVGIPSRLGFADVRNHLATQRLLALMGSDLFIYHGYAELYVGGRWVKLTPAFNLSLCEKFGVVPLDFDGTEDAVFQPYDTAGRRHMEYVHDHGTFSDMPFERIRTAYHEAYPKMFGHAAWSPEEQKRGDFYREAEQESAGSKRSA
jgi:transglutaminase-like putative cysteine protease